MFGPVVQEISFKDICIFSSGGNFVQRSRTVQAILVEDFIRSRVGISGTTAKSR